MKTVVTSVVILLAGPAVLPAQDAPDANAPLPAGAVMRLGETRFRTGGRVTHLAFSADGKQLASSGNWLYVEDRLSVWDTATGREVRTQSVRENQTGDLGWGPGGGLAVSRGGLKPFADAGGPESDGGFGGRGRGRVGDGGRKACVASVAEREVILVVERGVRKE